MGRIFYNKKWSNYLGEERALNDINGEFWAPPVPPSPTPTTTPTLTPTNTPTNTPTPSVTSS